MSTRNIIARPLTTLEFTLLGLAAQQPRSGYDFKTLFETTALRQFSSSPGSIYPALKRLDAAGLLSSRVRDSIGDRSRRVYTVAEAGRVELRRWLMEEPTLGELQRDLRLPILRFSLWGSIGLPARQAVRFLRHLILAAEAYGREVDRSARMLEGLTDPYPGWALDHGRISLEALADWSRRAIHEIEKEDV